MTSASESDIVYRCHVKHCETNLARTSAMLAASAVTVTDVTATSHPFQTCFCQVTKDRVCHNLLLSEDLGCQHAKNNPWRSFQERSKFILRYIENMVSIQARLRILEPPSTFYVGLSHHVAALILMLAGNWKTCKQFISSYIIYHHVYI